MPFSRRDRPVSKSELEVELLRQIREAGLPEPVREYRFAPPRHWRFDLAWPARHVAAEAEGGIWARGRHVRGGGFEGDCEKYNAATEAGWRVFRYTRQTIEDGEAAGQLARVLAQGEGDEPMGNRKINDAVNRTLAWQDWDDARKLAEARGLALLAEAVEPGEDAEWRDVGRAADLLREGLDKVNPEAAKPD